MQPHGQQVERLADLFWLLAHDERGFPRIGGQHFAIGLGTAVVGELLTQSSALIANDLLLPDLVVTHALDDLYQAGLSRDRIVRSPRVWIEWLGEEHPQRTRQDVVNRLFAQGLVDVRDRRPTPLDSMTAFTPVGLLSSAIESGTGSVVTRLFAGIALFTGLWQFVGKPDEDTRRPLQLLAMELPKNLYALLEALDNSISTLALRRR